MDEETSSEQCCTWRIIIPSSLLRSDAMDPVGAQAPVPSGSQHRVLPSPKSECTRGVEKEKEEEKEARKHF